MSLMPETPHQPETTNSGSQALPGRASSIRRLPPRVHSHPSLYQINTRLVDLSRDDVPDAELEPIAGNGFDWVWFLEVWQTGAAGRKVSLENPRVAARISGTTA
jgi:hypothetical protein